MGKTVLEDLLSLSGVKRPETFEQTKAYEYYRARGSTYARVYGNDIFNSSEVAVGFWEKLKAVFESEGYKADIMYFSGGVEIEVPLTDKIKNAALESEQKLFDFKVGYIEDFINGEDMTPFEFANSWGYAKELEISFVDMLAARDKARDGIQEAFLAIES